MSRYKVRAYCQSRSCAYVHKEDVIEAINHETAYGLALLYNESSSRPQCPLCGESMAFYSHSIIDEPWLP
ncbi:hypothetical protein [Paenibacillus sp. N3.4]|uniref:hypothetical protein n=1 Tax=Paenibacillus sp. N3.4 TaxID=2603222 RepID=UPI0016502204|nr:hypothetical protein [Paenibacillus sp. N3.4]